MLGPRVSKDGDRDAAATEELYKSVTKKFKTSSTFWLRFCLFKLKAGNVEGARKVLQRSLLSLPKRKHIAALAKFAQFEFKYGSAERGRTMFDSLMGTCPKRLDLWSVWLDMEEKQKTGRPRSSTAKPTSEPEGYPSTAADSVESTA